MSSMALLFAAQAAVAVPPPPILDAEALAAGYRARLPSIAELDCPRSADPEEIVVCARGPERSPYLSPIPFAPDPGRRVAGEVGPPSAGGLERCGNVGVATQCSGGLPIPSVVMAIVKAVTNAIENRD